MPSIIINKFMDVVTICFVLSTLNKLYLETIQLGADLAPKIDFIDGSNNIYTNKSYNPRHVIAYSHILLFNLSFIPYFYRSL